MNAHWMDWIAPLMQHLGGWIYWVAFLGALGETILLLGLFVPGSSLLLFLGALSASPEGPNLGLIYFAGVLGATLGDNINYWMGGRYGRRWIVRGGSFLRWTHVDKAEFFFQRHGGKSIFFSRFIPSLKEVVPFFAGIARMSRGWFMFWNFLGALGWGMQWVGVGFLFAQSLNAAEQWMSRATIGVVLVAGFIAAFWFLRRQVLLHGPTWWETVRSLGQAVATTLRQHPVVASWIERHPLTARILMQRLNRSRFTGLPLTLLLVAILYLLVLFGGLATDVLTNNAMIVFDRNILELMARLRTRVWLDGAWWVSVLGSWPVITGLTLLLMIWSWIVKRRDYWWAFTVSLAGSVVFALVGKWVIHRPRPWTAVVHETSFAFPSGHATVAVSVYGFFAYLWMRESRNWSRRVNIFFIWLFVALAIGGSRVILGVHYPTDVLGGYLVGSIWLLLSISLLEWWTLRHNHLHSVLSNLHRNLLAWSSLSMVMLTYVVVALWWQPKFALVNPTPFPVIRLHRSFSEWLPGSSLPREVTTMLGLRMEPVNIALVMRHPKRLTGILEKSGWQKVGHPSFKTLSRLWRSGISDRSAPAPLLFWGSEMQTIAFNRLVHHNHHLQMMVLLLWKTRFEKGANRLWIGLILRFDGMHWYGFRRLAPDLDQARDALPSLLCHKVCVRFSKTISWTKPKMSQTTIGDPFFTDGRLRLIVLQ